METKLIRVNRRHYPMNTESVCVFSSKKKDVDVCLFRTPGSTDNRAGWKEST